MPILFCIFSSLIALFHDNRGEFKPRFETVDGRLYYVEARTRYLLTEHFAESGKPLSGLLLRAIRFEEKEKDSCEKDL